MTKKTLNGCNKLHERGFSIQMKIQIDTRERNPLHFPANIQTERVTLLSDC